MLVEANWGNFRAKFNGREQKTFEWMASLFFYREHNHPLGASRYFNQAGIEAEPISVGSEVIGWQAKFTDRELASYKDQLVASITKAKAQHPTLTQIYFYINVDFGQGRKAKDPTYKTEIEAHAAARDVTVTWKTASFFESLFVCQTHAAISSHFFNLEPSIFDLVRQVAEHGDALLSPIQSKITVDSRTVRLDRQHVVEQLQQTLTRTSVVILSGDGGVGKTAVVKEFHSQFKDKAPFFVFKASEFNIRNVNELFSHYGALTLSQFIGAHRDVTEKYVVVDSAEKLADVEYPDVFQEFLSALRRDGWKIIFTTRLGYLEDLKYQLVERYGVPFEPLNVPGLTPAQLSQLASDHGFLLPDNERLRSLLHNLFYLKEYLRVYPQGSGTAEYRKFREALWNNEIEHTSIRRDNIHRRRGECFIQIARKRAAAGLFYVPMSGHDDALGQLEADEIIKFDSSAQGYFITHDIYEEWALERLVEQSYRAFAQRSDFYREIGDSLPVRRAFRTWLGEKLLSATDEASQLIVSTVEDSDTPRHWKDEAIVAALLSEQAGPLVQRFGRKMLNQVSALAQQTDSSREGQLSTSPQVADSSLLYQMLFLLRVACKEVDQNMLKIFPEEALRSRVSAFFTRPKGPGWTAMIEFAHQHTTEIGPLFLHAVLPVLVDWTSYHKTGVAPRSAGLMALDYLRGLDQDDENHRRPSGAVRAQLTTVVSNSSEEIKPELAQLFDEVIGLNDPDYDGPYKDLVETALSSIDKSALIAANLPKQVLGLANVFWRQTAHVPSHRGFGYRNDLEQHFNLPHKSIHDYYASAFRTPLLRLLQVDPQSTVSFILAFVNEAVAHYANSDLDKNEVEEIELLLPQADAPVKQFISRRLWLMYRGGMPAPSLLSSMHMALEKWLLHLVKKTEANIAERWCIYLLEHSRSASITAIVTSVLFAEPKKLANIAYIVLRCREILRHDIDRMTFEPEAKSLYAIANHWDDFFRNERFATCDEEHRKGSLEHITLSYQMFRSESESEAEAQARQNILWKILDDHYAQLDTSTTESPETKTWRLCLARMDRRKMTISSEVRDGGIQITFNPELDNDLRTYSETTLATLTDSMRYTGLHLWSRKRWERDKAGYSQYPQYDENPKQAVDETRTVYETLLSDDGVDGRFFLSNLAIPPSACAVLLRDFSAVLEPADVDFCKEVVLHYASTPFQQDYQYQIGDGVEAAIGVLPALLRSFPDDVDHIKAILLLTLLDGNPINMSDRFNSYAVAAIAEIAKTHPDVVDALFSGYLYIYTIWKSVCDAAVKDRHAGNWYGISHFELIQRLIQEHQDEFVIALEGGVGTDQLPAPGALEPEGVVTALELLPLGTNNAHHKAFAIEAAAVVIQGSQRRRQQEERFDYSKRISFYEKFAQLVLHADGPEIAHYMRPVLERFDDVEDADMLLQEFILIEDRTHRYDAFWAVWELLYPKIVKLCQPGGYKSNIVHNYLLAWPYWSKTAKQWGSLRDREKSFFARVATDIGQHPSVFYSFAKFLNEVGTPFVSDGILWISGIIERNPSLSGEKLEKNTEYYLENLIRGYVLSNRERIRRTLHVKQAVLRILNFLLERGSVTAYLTREHIL
ncbi:MAG: AVAST type 4 anti-phage nuclease Avs4 [Massilia sp.]